MYKQLFILFLSLILISCGGGGGGGSANQTTPTGTEHNSAPVISGLPSTIAVDENQTAVLTVTATDLNGHSIGYAVSGTDAASFEISTTGVLTFKTAPLYAAQSSFSINIEATDSLLTASEPLTVTLINIGPVISGLPSTIAVDENQTAVLTVTATDISGHSIGYAVSGTDAASFEISTTGVLTFKTAPLYVTKNSFSINIEATDSLLTASEPLTVTLNIPPFAWKTATPASQGFDATKLQAVVDYIFEDTWNTQGLIIIKNGKIVYEKYEGISDLAIAGHQRVFNPANSSAGDGWGTGWDTAKYQTVFGTRDQNSIGTTNSSSKSILGSVIGIAIDNGSINSLDDKVSQYITSWVGTVKEDITLKDMITMRSGLAEISVTKGLLGDHTLMYESVTGGDGLAIALARGLNPDPPANKWRYDGMGDPLILAEVLKIATGKDAKQYGEDNLFSKMGITDYDWWKDVAGNVLVWGNFESTLRDFAKFGLLWSKDTGLELTYGADIVGNGKWNGEQIISASWLEESVFAHVNPISKANCDADSRGYGYLMYNYTKLCDATDPTTELNVTVYQARGLNDNNVWWIPEHNLIVARHGLYASIINVGNEKILTGDISGTPGTANMNTSNYSLTINNMTLVNMSRVGSQYAPWNANWSYVIMDDEKMIIDMIEAIE